MSNQEAGPSGTTASASVSGIADANALSNIPIISTSTSSSSTFPIPTPTILESINHLLVSHSNSNLSLTHLHPHSPSAPKGKGKGKGRSGFGDGVDTIRDLKDSIGRLKNVLLGTGSGMGGSDEEGRLIRGLREISNHQSSILSIQPTLTPFLSSSLPSSSSSSSAQSFPSSLLLLTPTKLLEKISISIGLQCFIEDSQFGLLKSSLAIAGTKFVMDVDLEVDTLSGGEDGEDEDEPMTGSTVHTPGLEGNTINGAKAPNTKISENANANANTGKIKLSKIILNHITSKGETRKSEYLTKVLQKLIEDYLECHNEEENVDMDIWRKQVILERLIDGLKELKILDDYSNSITVSPVDSRKTEGVQIEGGEVDGRKDEGRRTDKDGFEEIEHCSKIVEGLSSSGSACKIYTTKAKTVFPTFHLLPIPSSPSSSPVTPSAAQYAESSNPIIKIRPPRPGEQVPSPSFNDNNGNTGSDGDINMESTTNSAPNWLDGWIVEIQPESENGIDGLVVRRNFLNPTEEVENDTMGGIKVENLLYRPFPPPPIPSLSQQAQLFPYASTFSHHPTNSTDSEGIEQKWSMVQPGPNAFVIGRIGVPKDAESSGKVLNLIRDQIVLNNLFTSIFKAQNMISDIQLNGIDDNGDEDGGDIDDLLSGDQNSIPINIKISQNSININFPLIKRDTSQIENIEVVVKASHSEKNGFVDVIVDGENTELGQEGGRRNLFDIISGVISKRR